MISLISRLQEYTLTANESVFELCYLINPRAHGLLAVESPHVPVRESEFLENTSFHCHGQDHPHFEVLHKYYCVIRCYHYAIAIIRESPRKIEIIIHN